ncbi:coiled-coil domain-containing protein 177-like [Lepisosteus oculatus]|uniref:coiled-coil domain-containing protein 177-like n=1 Tax=Lepisosteus oculatus TaxID=7918 RepID=UPI0035F5223E
MEADRPASPMLHLDLYSFESTAAEGSRYVLTSPRSLEACARLGVRPVDLLHRALSEFVVDNPDAPLRKATEMYEAHEKDRRRRLRECREERQKILEEELGRRTPVPTALRTPAQPQSAEQSTVMQPSDFRAKKAEEGWAPSKRVKSSELDTSKPESPKGRSLQESREHKSPRAGWEHPGLREYIAKSFSLGDLSHSLATEKKLEKLIRDIRRQMSITVPEKDRKIAALMLVKHEEEQSQQQRRLQAELRRDEARRRESLRKERVERARRQERCCRLERWQLELEARRRRVEQEERQLASLREQSAILHEDRWRLLAEEQEARRQEKTEMAQQEANGKKRCQEQLLKEKELEEQALREKQGREAQERIIRAGRSKMLKERREKRKIQLENQQKRVKHLLLKREVESQIQAEELLKRIALEQKLLKSSNNYHRVLEARLQELKERSLREEEHLLRAQSRAEKHLRERQKHKEALAQVMDRRMRQALEVAGTLMQRRAELARQANTEKDKSHRLLYEKVQEEQETLQQQLKADIAVKDRRSEQLLRDKEAAVEESRKVARASFQMREKVREQIHSRSFDQMALEAQLRASLSRIKL